MFYNAKIATSYIIFTIFTLDLVSCYHVVISDDGPMVKGSKITFTAHLFDGNEPAAPSKYYYEWKDLAIPSHSRQVDSRNATDTWTVEYNRTVYPQGDYVVQVAVSRYFVFKYPIASQRKEFTITETLNGQIELLQNNSTRHNRYVSNAQPVNHEIVLKQPDYDLVREATTITTHWFVDCVYYGYRNDFQFPFNYTTAEQEHIVEALIVADFTPLPPPTTAKPITTTLKPNTTTIQPNTTTTIRPNTTTTAKLSTSPKLVKRDVKSNKIMVMKNGTLVPYNETAFPYVCNTTKIATDPSKVYGYFMRQLTTKQPIQKVNVTGNNWLQHGDILSLNIKCTGSKLLKYCVKYFTGIYNVTGNETCGPDYGQLDECEFSIQRYLIESTIHTIIVIIENDVSKVIQPVTVTVYKVKKQAQLSVIVVPVASSLVAVVLIVFGIAYYFQNRSRFVVEVADFNFGQNYTDMEYKTFQERLRDSIVNAFTTRPGPSPSSSDVPVWPPGRKYGSMTT